MGTRIKQVLLERIVDGTYKPGERLKELQIARQFNTSQAPVREALRELEAVGLIQTQYYQGSRVRLSTEREMREAYEIRAVLEQMAAHSAADKLKFQTKQLKAMVDKATFFSRKGVWLRYTRYNYLFHRSIASCVGVVAFRTPYTAFDREDRLDGEEFSSLRKGCSRTLCYSPRFMSRKW
jgi:DNA-binding GntR family transcriptional regulator